MEARVFWFLIVPVSACLLIWAAYVMFDALRDDRACRALGGLMLSGQCVEVEEIPL